MPLTESLWEILSLPAGLAGTIPLAGSTASSTVPVAASGTGETTTSNVQSNASALCNLLPSFGQAGESTLSAGIYVGEGLLPVPAKLADKITQWEFVEMAELLLEFWSAFNPKDPPGATGTRPTPVRRKRTVTDVATWVQCFAMYTSVMSIAHPGEVPELLAYLIFILRASQDFGGMAWVTYDAAFQRQAFITGNHQWSKVNPSIMYSICFSGVARTGQRCELCLSLSYTTQECTLIGDTDPEVSSRLEALESAVLAFSARSPGSTRPSELCRNFNAGRCRMTGC